jgi:hypothetical protein
VVKGRVKFECLGCLRGWAEGAGRRSVKDGRRDLLCAGADRVDYKKEPESERCKRKILHSSPPSDDDYGSPMGSR